MDHPTLDELRSFEVGDLSEEAAAAVDAHLADCVACCDALAGLPADGFVTWLRMVRPHLPSL